MSDEAGRTIPRFGEWDVNNPASADGFTVIFNKARDEKKGGHGTLNKSNSQDAATAEKMRSYASRSNSKKWFCCVSPSPTLP